MTSIQSYLTSDHHHCDELFTEAEGAVEQANWTEAANKTKAFTEAMEHHFSMEEEILFPAFEAVMGSSAGPTMVMRAEHAQMRELFAALLNALEEKNKEAFLGASETLLIVMQQHNMKEENILYMMSDKMIQGSEKEQLLTQMQAL